MTHNFKHVSKNDTNITPQKSVDMTKNDYIREILKGWFHYMGGGGAPDCQLPAALSELSY